MKPNLPYFLMALFLLFLLPLTGADQDSLPRDSVIQENEKSFNQSRIYKFDIKKEIGPAVWRITKKSFADARSWGADHIIIHMNTYGGLVNIADSIRTLLLNSAIPVYVLIDKNAASAGALISIACDSIYMTPGSSIGAATVVNQQGEAAPDKYQSYMRATMRATAEAQGKDTIIEDGDTIYQWRRNPAVAEAMVDESVVVDGISKEGEVLTFTATEALENNFADAIVQGIPEVVKRVNHKGSYELKSFELTPLERLIGWLVNPAVQGILVMIIIGGIYFEIQSPGIGFPIAAAAIAAIVYFAPAYLEGLAENWELLLFIGGLILIAVEIFVIPGFGVAGILGLILVVAGLVLSMIDNVVFDLPYQGMRYVARSFFTVVVAMVLSLAGAIYMSHRLFSHKGFSRLALQSNQLISEGFISSDQSMMELIGATGVAFTVLRPSGKVEINDELYDARSMIGMIEKGESVKVIEQSQNQLYVIKLKM